MRMPASPTRPVWEMGLPWERRRAPPGNHNIVRFALHRETRRSNEFNVLRNCWVRRASLFFQGVSEWLPKLERGEASIHSGWRPCRWKPIVMRPNLIGASHWSDVRDRPRAPNCVPPPRKAHSGAPASAFLFTQVSLRELRQPSFKTLSVLRAYLEGSQ